MRTTFYILFSLFVAGTTWAAETFDMTLPDDSQGPSSGGFVDSFYQAPAAATVEDETSRGSYESAFTSFRTKKSSDEEADDHADVWRAGQEKPDNFDIENLTYTAPAKQAPKAQARVKAPPMKAKAAGNRAPASVVDDIPMPDGGDLNSEIDRTTASIPDVNPGPAPVSAKERKAMILQTISDNYGDLKTCYQDGLRRKSDMKGKVVLGWNMDPQGRVSGAEVQTSQLNNKQVEKCMVDRLSNWRFPRQAKLQSNKDRMTYTFQFVPEKD